MSDSCIHLPFILCQASAVGAKRSPISCLTERREGSNPSEPSLEFSLWSAMSHPLQNAKWRYSFSQMRRYEELEKEMRESSPVSSSSGAAAAPIATESSFAFSEAATRSTPIPSVNSAEKEQELVQRTMARRSLRSQLSTEKQRLEPAFRYETLACYESLLGEEVEKLVAKETNKILDSKSMVADVLQRHRDGLDVRHGIEADVGEWSKGLLDISEIGENDARLKEIELEQAEGQYGDSAVVQGTARLNNGYARLQGMRSEIATIVRDAQPINTEQGRLRTTGTLTTLSFPSSSEDESVAQDIRDGGLREHQKIQEECIAALQSRIERRNEAIFFLMRHIAARDVSWKRKTAERSAAKRVLEGEIAELHMLVDWLQTGVGFTFQWDLREQRQEVDRFLNEEMKEALSEAQHRLTKSVMLPMSTDRPEVDIQGLDTDAVSPAQIRERAEFREKIAELRTSIDEHRKDLDSKEDVIAVQEEAAKQAAKEIAGLNSTIDHFQRSNEQKSAKISSLETDIIMWRTRYEDLQKHRAEEVAQLKQKFKEELEKSSELINSLRFDVDKSEKSVESIVAMKSSHLVHRNLELESALQQLKDLVKVHETRADELNRQIGMLVSGTADLLSNVVAGVTSVREMTDQYVSETEADALRHAVWRGTRGIVERIEHGIASEWLHLHRERDARLGRIVANISTLREESMKETQEDVRRVLLERDVERLSALQKDTLQKYRQVSDEAATQRAKRREAIGVLCEAVKGLVARKRSAIPDTIFEDDDLERKVPEALASSLKDLVIEDARIQKKLAAQNENAVQAVVKMSRAADMLAVPAAKLLDALSVVSFALRRHAETARRSIVPAAREWLASSAAQKADAPSRTVTSLVSELLAVPHENLQLLYRKVCTRSLFKIRVGSYAKQVKQDPSNELLRRRMSHVESQLLKRFAALYTASFVLHMKNIAAVESLQKLIPLISRTEHPQEAKAPSTDAASQCEQANTSVAAAKPAAAAKATTISKTRPTPVQKEQPAEVQGGPRSAPKSDAEQPQPALKKTQDQQSQQAASVSDTSPQVSSRSTPRQARSPRVSNASKRPVSIGARSPAATSPVSLKTPPEQPGVKVEVPMLSLDSTAAEVHVRDAGSTDTQEKMHQPAAVRSRMVPSGSAELHEPGSGVLHVSRAHTPRAADVHEASSHDDSSTETQPPSPTSHHDGSAEIVAAAAAEQKSIESCVAATKSLFDSLTRHLAATVEASTFRRPAVAPSPAEMQAAVAFLPQQAQANLLDLAQTFQRNFSRDISRLSDALLQRRTPASISPRIAAQQAKPQPQTVDVAVEALDYSVPPEIMEELSVLRSDGSKLVEEVALLKKILRQSRAETSALLTPIGRAQSPESQTPRATPRLQGHSAVTTPVTPRVHEQPISSVLPKSEGTSIALEHTLPEMAQREELEVTKLRPLPVQAEHCDAQIETDTTWEQRQLADLRAAKIDIKKRRDALAAQQQTFRLQQEVFRQHQAAIMKSKNSDMKPLGNANEEVCWESTTGHVPPPSLLLIAAEEENRRARRQTSTVEVQTGEDLLADFICHLLNQGTSGIADGGAPPNRTLPTPYVSPISSVKRWENIESSIAKFIAEGRRLNSLRHRMLPVEQVNDLRVASATLHRRSVFPVTTPLPSYHPSDKRPASALPAVSFPAVFDRPAARDVVPPTATELELYHTSRHRTDCLGVPGRTGVYATSNDMFNPGTEAENQRQILKIKEDAAVAGMRPASCPPCRHPATSRTAKKLAETRIRARLPPDPAVLTSPKGPPDTVVTVPELKHEIEILALKPTVARMAMKQHAAGLHQSRGTQQKQAPGLRSNVFQAAIGHSVELSQRRPSSTSKSHRITANVRTLRSRLEVRPSLEEVAEESM